MNATWLNYLPAFLRAKLDGRFNLQAILGNSGWLFADKVLRMGVGLLVGVWVTRYLGPEKFGQLSYAIAFALAIRPRTRRSSLANLADGSIKLRKLDFEFESPQ